MGKMATCAISLAEILYCKCADGKGSSNKIGLCAVAIPVPVLRREAETSESLVISLGGVCPFAVKTIPVFLGWRSMYSMREGEEEEEAIKFS